MLVDSSLTPSARILAEMQKNKESFTEFSMRKAIEYRVYTFLVIEYGFTNCLKITN